ncbi:MAG: outer membrane beta-barrel protein [Vicinamibacterales bacterium]
MSAVGRTVSRARALSVALVVALLATSAPAFAQDEGVQVRGVAFAGSMRFTSSDSFDAVLGSASGPIVGGGGQVILPLGVYFEVTAWRYSADGERVFVGPDGDVFHLGIPVSVTVTPIEVTAGWRFRLRTPKLVPYVGGGWTSARYQESSEFADAEEEADSRHSGFHLVGGAEFRALPWLGVGGEVAWSRVPDALGDAGVSAAFDENDLGGTSLRVKITLGR